MTYNRQINSAQLGVGLAIMLLGLLFLLDRFDIIYIGDYWRFWPAILIVMGIGKAMKPMPPGVPREGIWLIIIGSWLLLNQTSRTLTYRDSWPLLLIASGGYMVYQAVLRQNLPQAENRQEGSDDAPHS